MKRREKEMKNHEHQGIIATRSTINNDIIKDIRKIIVAAAAAVVVLLLS